LTRVPTFKVPHPRRLLIKPDTFTNRIGGFTALSAPMALPGHLKIGANTCSLCFAAMRRQQGRDAALSSEKQGSYT